MINERATHTHGGIDCDMRVAKTQALGLLNAVPESYDKLSHLELSAKQKSQIMWKVRDKI